MFMTRAEKDLFMSNAVTMGTIDFLREELEEKAFMSTSEKRAFTYTDNALTEVNEHLLEKHDNPDKFTRRLARRLDNERLKIELSKFPDVENEVQVYFSNFSAAYIGVRDTVNYFSINKKKLPKELLTKVKSAKTRFGKVLKAHLDDAELGHYYPKLNNKIDKYEYEVELICLQ